MFNRVSQFVKLPSEQIVLSDFANWKVIAKWDVKAWYPRRNPDLFPKAADKEPTCKTLTASPNYPVCFYSPNLVHPGGTLRMLP